MVWLSLVLCYCGGSSRRLSYVSVGLEILTRLRAFWEQANLKIVRSGFGDGIGAEVSDDEVILQREDATVKLQMLERYSSLIYTGPSFDAAYPDFLAWRMG